MFLKCTDNRLLVSLESATFFQIAQLLSVRSQFVCLDCQLTMQTIDGSSTRLDLLHVGYVLKILDLADVIQLQTANIF